MLEKDFSIQVGQGYVKYLSHKPTDAGIAGDSFTSLELFIPLYLLQDIQIPLRMVLYEFNDTSIHLHAPDRIPMKDGKFSSVQDLMPIEFAFRECWTAYRRLIGMGVPRTVARIVLPLGAYARVGMVIHVMEFIQVLIWHKATSKTEHDIHPYLMAMQEIIFQAFPEAMAKYKAFEAEEEKRKTSPTGPAAGVTGPLGSPDGPGPSGPEKPPC